MRLPSVSWLLLTLAVPALADTPGTVCREGSDDACFLAVPGGSFQMGAQATDPSAPRFDPLAGPDEVVTTVTVAAFEITELEVSRGAYGRCVAERHCAAPPADYFEADTHLSLPVVGVTRAEGEAYCRSIGGRLPTAAEWEYAARAGGQDRRYPWGSEPYCPLLTPDEERAREQRLGRLASQCPAITTHALPRFDDATGKELSLLIDTWTDTEFLVWCKQLATLPPAQVEAAVRAGMAERHATLSRSTTLPTCATDGLVQASSGIRSTYGSGYAANAGE